MQGCDLARPGDGRSMKITGRSAAQDPADQTYYTVDGQTVTPAPKHNSWYWRVYVLAGTAFLKGTTAVLRTYTQYC